MDTKSKICLVYIGVFSLIGPAVSYVLKTILLMIVVIISAENASFDFFISMFRHILAASVIGIVVDIPALFAIGVVASTLRTIIGPYSWLFASGVAILCTAGLRFLIFVLVHAKTNTFSVSYEERIMTTWIFTTLLCWFISSKVLGDIAK